MFLDSGTNKGIKRSAECGGYSRDETIGNVDPQILYMNHINQRLTFKLHMYGIYLKKHSKGFDIVCIT
jgi:hypothetical protein